MKFSKMHGLGNDFMIVNCITQKNLFSSELIRKISNRHLGVGFDQLLIVESAHNAKFDFHYRIFNADGNEVEQCGNGARCFALFLKLKKLINKKTILVSTKTSNIILKFVKNKLICVNMGEPNFDPNQIPFIINKSKDIYFIKCNKKTLAFSIVSMGNPHCVIQIDDITKAEIKTIGPIIEHHKYFPKSVNVSFMEIINDKHIRLRVHERGVGETKSCGTAACAAVACGIKQGLLSSKVRVDLIGGTLHILWKGNKQPLYMIGSATHVYDGYIYI
ncbi:MAG: diaminopimelate epimerase [Pantoea sp. Brub]|nr:diaminopimelate epimerase [Pantoea sp. Brub]